MSKVPLPIGKISALLKTILLSLIFISAGVALLAALLPYFVLWYLGPSPQKAKAERDGIWIARYIGGERDNIQEMARVIQKDQGVKINTDFWIVNKDRFQTGTRLWAFYNMPIDGKYLVVRQDKGLYWITKEELDKDWNFKTNQFVAGTIVKTPSIEPGGAGVEKEAK
jgi:hypothetical protein